MSYHITAEEVEEMFGPEGNFVDYWLGTPGAAPASRDGVWVTAETYLRALRDQEGDEPDRDDVESWMDPDSIRGGGLMGSTPELVLVRSGLMAVGQAGIDDERRRARLGRRN
jgi:hypothetical protein